MLLLVLLALAVQVLAAETTTEMRDAAARALPLLERSTATFVGKRACVSCHHNDLAVLTLRLARERGLAVGSSVLEAVERATLQELVSPKALDDAVQSANLADPTPNDSYLLMAAHAAGLPQSLVTGIYARRLLGWQREGHWVTSDFRPPHSSSTFTATATAIRAIGFYLPGELREQGERSLAQARQWLLAARPISTEDAAFRVLGLVWGKGTSAEIDIARRDLLALQKLSGGWPELPDYQADAYSTGEALFALHESGIAPESSQWRRGARFLVSTQATDGSWHVRTRMLSPASVSPRYFSTGFPYERDEYISYAATCWAVMALVSALPQAPVKDEAPGLATAWDAPPWAAAALFGTPQQLGALLDSGLDPNSRTSDGTTLLMMAAPDVRKVRLLLHRGADVKARAASGCDALTAAAAYRGTAPALEVMLDAGAAIDPPKDVHARSSALVLTSMTGDPDAVKLLLQRGASASAAAGANTPLTAALTFGYPDIARALIGAGASVNITESTGINLLHWAAITNRAAVIPLLATAGVPVNATDENGFTPLMYAATIDFGDDAVVAALLRAGADKSIRNGDGRTPLEQARFYHHARPAAALR
ncbi:MAG: ankyrin repeat domain-containing protein [Acidobacteriia bacterium]|nr:ankyrin repeat domain-containing protein [Terriglobia bacterium]